MAEQTDADKNARVHAAMDAYKTAVRSIHSTVAPQWMQLDIPLGQMRALFAIDREESLTVGSLAESLGLGLSATSILSDKLVQQGLVERREGVADRRRTYLSLSPTAMQLLAGLQDGPRERMQQWLAQMAEDDLEALIRGLQALGTVAAEEDKSALQAAS